MKIKKSSIPAGSLTRNYLPADYTDVFACNVQSAKEFSPDDIMVGFWTRPPRWVEALFKIRNFLVKFVGLKGSDDNDMQRLEACIRDGGSHEIASVPTKNDNETVVLLSDKHLCAYMSVLIEKEGESRKISAVTVVHFKNRLGRIYFFFVRPFHILVTKSLLRRSITNRLK